MTSASPKLTEHRNSPYLEPAGRVRKGPLLAAAAVLAVAAVAAVVGLVAMPNSDKTLWRPSLPTTSGLVTNELAHTHPTMPGVVTSPDWIVTSGSLFSDGGAGWTGPIDGATPDLHSHKTTGSAVFRVVSRRSDFKDVSVSFDLDVGGTVRTPRTGSHAYDGVHVFLRYTSPQSLYAVSLDRRDGTAAIKVKTPGGPSNGGDYTTLAQTEFDFPQRQWVHEKVTIVDEGPHRVRITLWTDGVQVLSTVSAGTGAKAALTGAGRVGLRGDNTAFHFRNFTVAKA